MDPKRRYKYHGGNIDELAKPKLIKRESKGTIKKESVDKINKSNNYKVNKKIIPNNISINNNKQNKNTGYKFSETQYSSKKKNNMNDYKIVKNKGHRNNSNNKNNNNSYQSNKNDMYSNSSSKQRSKNSFFEENNKKNNIKQKRFSNIDDAVILIQRCFRKYLDKIHNTNSELMKLIQERKKNILENYNILDNQPIFGNNENKNNNINYENYDQKTNLYNNLASQFNNNKIKQLKEDIIIGDYS